MAWFTCALAQGGAGKCKLGEMVNMPVTMNGLRPMVNAKINGNDVRLSLDSGAFYSMISPASAAALKLHVFPAPRGFYLVGIGGRIQVSLAKADTVYLAGLALHDVEFIVGGNDEIGESIGLLGRNFLEIGDIDFDLAQGTVRLMAARDCDDTMLAYWAHAGDSYSTMPIEAPLRFSGWESKKTQYAERYIEPIAGKAFVNGIEIRVIFDTGSPTSYLTVRAAAKAGIKLGTPGVTAAGYGLGIGRGQVANYLAQVASFKIGDEEVRNTQLRLGDTDDIDKGRADMLIGADFFLSHHVYVANSQHKLYFTYSGGPVFNLKTVVAAASQPTPGLPGDHSGSPEASPAAGAQTVGVASSSASEAGVPTPQTSTVSAAPPAAQDPKRLEEADADARRGMGFAARQQFDQALPELNRACELAPDNPDYFYQRGSIFAEIGERNKAMADFDRALQLKPNHVLALFARGDLRIRTGDKAGAQADLDAANDSVPKEDALHFLLAGAYGRLGQFQRSIEQYDLWIASHPSDAKLYGVLEWRCRMSALGDLDLQHALGDCNQSLAHAKKLSPFYAEVIGNRGLVRLRLGNFDQSIADFDDSLKIAPRNAWYLYARGIDKIRMTKTAEGEADIAQAKAISADIAETFKTYGIVP